ncbi:MAG: 5-deoxy-glucuronate isomerase [Gammaproteobacteria bacterium]|jgi:5-deoxy-glucuronate isomerase|nr:5-deoxyglucuronate isomerase [Acidiferrobacteraceae bacterium]MCP4924834.1 5-deoxy-glucuronate isomerase [Gammaproteobacteria bacterium]|tara:strand:+ start:4478 stop:5317 length:840 start_codon:yes stop_codon:yes gene_type:complete
MHIPHYDNHNQAIIDCHHDRVPLCYFNIIKLRAGQSFSYRLDDYESCLVPASGSIDVQVQGQVFKQLGQRHHIWQGNPEGAYIPVGCQTTLTCVSDEVEVFLAGARYDQPHEAFVVRENHIDPVQYGSDDTKTHRKIKHILGQNPPGKVGRLLVSELFTVGAGGWSGFPPHKHDTDRLPQESHHDEVYNFRFNPVHGFGAQFLTPAGEDYGPVHHIRNGSTIIVDQGYHPCVAAPGYEMYYFTILAGQSQRPLHQYFHPDHAYQLETIPGIKDMISKFK